MASGFVWSRFCRNSPDWLRKDPRSELAIPCEWLYVLYYIYSLLYLCIDLHMYALMYIRTVLFIKKLNDVGWSTGGQHPVGQRSVSSQSSVGQRSVNGRSPGRVKVNTYVIIIK